MYRAITGAAAEAPRFVVAYAVDVWNRLNATTFRITITMFVVVTTSIRYQLSGIEIGRCWIVFKSWEPSDSWLIFLASMAGIDMVQFAAKRYSTRPELMAKAETKVEEVVTANGGNSGITP